MSPWGGRRPGDEITGKQPCWEFVLLSPWYLRDHIADWLSGSQSPYCSPHEPRTSMSVPQRLQSQKAFLYSLRLRTGTNVESRTFILEYIQDDKLNISMTNHLKCCIYLLDVHRWIKIIDLFFVAMSIVYQQESIPDGCVPPACQPYVFWWLPLGVSNREISIPEVVVGIPRGFPRGLSIPEVVRVPGSW